MTNRQIFGRDLPFGARYPHGSNICKKIKDLDTASSKRADKLIHAVAMRYREWRETSESEVGDDEKNDDWRGFVERVAEAYESYRAFLDEERIDAFDSRSALQSSALEEFCTYLLSPLVAELGGDVDLGHRDVFHGLYFSAANFEQFSKLPDAFYQRANVDFVISKRLVSSFSDGGTAKEEVIYIPVVAIECKTYLDKPRWFESEMLADNLKRGFPYCRHYLLAEFLKLDTRKVNIVGSRLDHVYVLRRSPNVDRRKRRADGAKLPPIHVPAVHHLFLSVKTHLTTPWEPELGWQDSGVLK